MILGNTQIVTDDTQEIESTIEDEMSAPAEMLDVVKHSAPKKQNSIRAAFKALLGPLWPGKQERQESNSTERIGPILPPLESQEWLADFHRARQLISHQTSPARVVSEQLVASLQHYNVRPEEYAIYEQWINLLQPDVEGARNYWLRTAPSSSTAPVNHPRSPLRETYHELDGSSRPVELGDTGVPVDQAYSDYSDFFGFCKLRVDFCRSLALS
jgi:hypothetical protein